VVFNEAQRAHLLGNANHDRLVAIVGLSMAITPLLMIALLKLLGQEKAAPRAAAEADKVAPDNRPKVLIAGMGRFGQVIARLLTAQKVPFVALEANPDTVADLRRFGNQLYYGDPTRPEMLRAAGGEHIDVFVITVDDPETNLRAVRMVRRLYPDATVLARARNRQHAWRLMDMSAEPFREVFGTSLEMSGRVLTALGVAPDVAERHVQRFREHDEQLLRDQYLVDARPLNKVSGQPFKIEFTNNDDLDHNVGIWKDDEEVFRGEIFSGPETMTYLVNGLEAGEYRFICDVHPSMTGTLTVK